MIAMLFGGASAGRFRELQLPAAAAFALCQQASAMTHAELAAALLGTQIARGHGDLDLWRRQLRTVTVATFILAVATIAVTLDDLYM